MLGFGVHSILLNPLKYSSHKYSIIIESFYLAKNTLVCRRFVRISQDYPFKIWPSKQPTGKILGYGIIPTHPLKYSRSNQDLQ
jgi:hypothetical protein